VLYQRGTVTTGTVALSDATRLAIEEYAENVRIGQKPFQYDVSQDAGVKFEDFVPAALATQALTASSLIVVPHGVLHLLPWPALISGERRLFEITEVGVLPNVSCLHVLAGEPPAKPKAAILGNPSYEGLSDVPELPAAGPEVADVAALYSGRLLTEPITGQAATEAAFWGLWDLDGKDAILHVTSHGVNAT